MSKQNRAQALILEFNPKEIRTAALKAVEKVDNLDESQIVEEVLIFRAGGPGTIDVTLKHKSANPAAIQDISERLDHNLRQILRFVCTDTNQRVLRGSIWDVPSWAGEEKWSVLGSKRLLPYIYKMSECPRMLDVKQAKELIKALPELSWEDEWASRELTLRSEKIMYD